MRAAEGVAELAARKAAVRARIAAGRAVTVEAVKHAVRPLRLVDQGIALWRATPEPVKTVGIPLAVLAATKLARRLPIFAVAKYIPVAAQGWRMFQEMRRRRAAG